MNKFKVKQPNRIILTSQVPGRSYQAGSQIVPGRNY